MEDYSILGLGFLCISLVCSLLLLIHAILVKPDSIATYTYSWVLIYTITGLVSIFTVGDFTPSQSQLGEPPSNICTATAFVWNGAAYATITGVLAMLVRVFRIFQGSHNGQDSVWYLMGMAVSVAVWIGGSAVLSARAGFSHVIIRNGFLCDIAYGSAPTPYMTVGMVLIFGPGTILSGVTWFLWFQHYRNQGTRKKSLPLSFYLRILLVSSYFIIGGYVTVYSYVAALLYPDPLNSASHKFDIATLLVMLIGEVLFLTFGTTATFWPSLWGLAQKGRRDNSGSKTAQTDRSPAPISRKSNTLP